MSYKNAQTRTSGIFAAAFMIMALGCKPQKSQKIATSLSAAGTTEVPGYIVELVDMVSYGMSSGMSSGSASTSASTQTTYEYTVEPSCIGAHIGEGFILTAGHCVFSRVCSSDPSGLYHLGIRYLSSDGTTQVMDSGTIEAIAFHKHIHKVSADKTLMMPILNVEHDIALIKVSSIPFKSAARVPLLPEQHFAQANISGKFYMFQPDQGSKTGTMGPVTISSKSTLASVMTSQAASEFQKQNIRLEDYQQSLETFSPELLARSYPSCLSLGPNGAVDSIAAHSFSEDGTMDADPSLSSLIRQSIESSGKVYEELKKPAYDRDQTRLAKEAEKTATMFLEALEDSIAIEPGEDVSGFCPGYSGGPVVQSGGMEDVVVAVISSGLTHTHDDQGSVSSRCSQLEGTASTYHNLSWIKAAKASILAGRHAVQSKSSHTP